MRNGALALVAVLVACGGGVDIDGNVYELDIDDMEITGADPDLAPVLALFFARAVLLQTYEADSEGFSVRMGYAIPEGDAQDECIATSALPEATLADLAFDMGPESTDITTRTTTLTIGDMEASGTFSEEYDRMDTLSIAGSVDLRDTVGFAGITSPEGACDTFGGLGLTCGACADSQPYCVDLELTSLSADLSDLALVPVTASEASSNCLEE